jgi:hypothetical protein
VSKKGQDFIKTSKKSGSHDKNPDKTNMNPDVMNKFGFLLGNWNLEYRIAKSIFSEARSDSGTGSFRKALNGKYVFFDYSTKSGGEAHGIFAWDDKVKIYRFWWFENSGNFMTATCDFIDEQTLNMNWHNSLLVQTFTKDNPDQVTLRMRYPTPKGEYECVLTVILTRK